MELKTNPNPVSLVQNQPTFSFMTFVRSVTNRGVPVMYPPGTLSAWGLRNDHDALRDEQRARYASHQATSEDQAETPDEPGGTDGSASCCDSDTVSADYATAAEPEAQSCDPKDTGDEETAAKW